MTTVDTSVPRRVSASRVREPMFVWLFVLGVFADMINGNSKNVGLPISPDRLLFSGAIVLVLADPAVRREVRLRWRLLHTLMVGLVLWVIYSGLVAGSITTQFGLYALLDRLIMPFLAFSLAPMIFATPQRRDLLLKTLTVMGIYLGLTGIFEVFGPHSLVFPSYIMNPDIGLHFGQARGPFVEAEADGMVMIACGLAAGVLASRTPKGSRWRWACWVALPATGMGAFLAQERSVWGGAVLATTAAFLLTPRLRKLLPVAIAGVAVAVGVALAVSPSLQAQVNGRATDNLSLYDRQNTDAAAIRVVESHPLTGLGWVEFEVKGSDYVRLSPNYPITNVHIEVHNVYLGRAAELGIPGALLFISILANGVGRAVLRRWRPGFGPTDEADDDRAGWHIMSIGMALSYGFASMTSPLPYPLPNLLVWLFAGIVLAPYLAPRPPRPVAPSVTADGSIVIAPAAAEASRAA